MSAHFDIAVFIDCWDLNCFKSDLLSESNENLENDRVRLPNILSGCTKLMNNFKKVIPSEITFDYMIAASYGKCDSHPKLKSLLESHPSNFVFDFNKNHNTRPDEVINHFNLNNNRRILICGLDLNACILYRQLGVLAWLNEGHRVFMHRQLVAESSANLDYLNDLSILNSNKSPSGRYYREGLSIIPIEDNLLKVVKI